MNGVAADSQYTPLRSPGPIIRKTLEPILTRLGEPTASREILDLTIADIAWGPVRSL